MPSRTALLQVYGVWLILEGGTAQAQISVVQSSDGTTGTITHLGDSHSIYSDSHGNTGAITSPGGGFQSYTFTSPQGGTTTGTITTFGSPEPPSNLTPAPVLPFNPNGTLMPQPCVAPVVPSSPGGTSSFGSSAGGGRFGCYVFTPSQLLPIFRRPLCTTCACLVRIRHDQLPSEQDFSDRLARFLGPARMFS